ncbi:unnamed protein product [Paramecium pentaurelia]|uniref:Uncharacterized protein n=1 Tax=Paramecium pentaurelia TaxID=43138 RepID=A0A8S1VTX4_9CILI|nr:unnamed protein product [Paramecium pentaurelia]
MSFMNQNIIDKINSFGQTLCIQLINNEMISLIQLKANNFLVTTATKYYQVPNIEESKPKKKYQNLAKMQQKFQIEKEDYHSVLKEEIIQMQKNKFPLMPFHLHQKPNNARIVNRQMTTQKMNRDIHRDTNQPILAEFNKQLLCKKDIGEIIDKSIY